MRKIAGKRKLRRRLRLRRNRRLSRKKIAYLMMTRKRSRATRRRRRNNSLMNSNKMMNRLGGADLVTGNQRRSLIRCASAKRIKDVFNGATGSRI